MTCGLFLALIVFAGASMAAPCPGQRCLSLSPAVNDLCNAKGFSGSVVYLKDELGVCTCSCSCVSNGTPVAIGDGKWVPIESLEKGNTVLALSEDNTWVSTSVEESEGTDDAFRRFPYVIFVETTNGKRFVVTPDHPFLLEDGHLKTACTLNIADALMGDDLKPVAIRRLGFGTCEGRVHSIVTKDSGTPAHLINTGGIVSGDYHAQLFMTQEGPSLPKIGSPEYTMPLERPSPEGFISEPMQSSPGGCVFRPYAPIEVPPYALFLIPPEFADPAPNSLRDLDDAGALDVAQSLIARFKAVYPDVDYTLDWFGNTPNARTWVDDSGHGHVVIFGGVARNKTLREEGLALILAHETGHVYGGPPKRLNGRESCEGQADYWGAKVALRALWYGADYYKKVEIGMHDFYELLSHGLKTNLMCSSPPPDGHVKCDYPGAACRLETFKAGEELAPKPACAD